MPFCKKCGTLYPQSLGVCPKCNADEILAAQPPELQPAQLSEQESARRRKSAWIGVCIGVPGLIALLYGIYYIMQQLSR